MSIWGYYPVADLGEARPHLIFRPNGDRPPPLSQGLDDRPPRSPPPPPLPLSEGLDPPLVSIHRAFDSQYSPRMNDGVLQCAFKF